MASQVDKLLKIFRSVTKDPSPAAAYILHNTVDSFHVNLTWNQRSLDRGKSVKFQTSNIVNLNSTEVISFPPVDVSSELLTATSKSTNFRAVLREVVTDKNAANGKKQQHLEIWAKSNLLSTLDLTALDVHGDVYADSEFGSLEWSPCEEKLLYIAEKKVPKTEPFYKASPQDSGKESETSDKKPSKGEEYVYRQDWGEALVGKHHPVVVVCNVTTEKLHVLEGVPDDLSPGQVSWAPDGGVVGVGWKHVPRRLGLIYCTNRRGCIFHLTSNGEFRTLSSKEDLAVRSPRFSPNNDFLLWLERPATGPHHSAHRLIKFDWATKASTTLVDIVKDRSTISDGNEFYGLYCTALLRRCFISPNEVVVSTPQKFVVKSYIVNTDTKSVKEIQIGDLGSLIALDVFDKKIICAHTCLRYPWEIKFTRYNNGQFSAFNTIKSTTLNPGLEPFGIDYISLQSDAGDAWTDYSAIYLGPTNKTENKSVPLVLFPHGGPHSAFSDSYTTCCALFAMMGFAVVMVNYRGSIGQGEGNVDFLPGRVGDTDVKDCHNAAIKVCEKYSYIDPDRIVLYGGSHGGFLVCHLSGQYPKCYRAVVARNPVLNILDALFISDIPDWAAVEAGITYTPTTEVDLNSEQLNKMRKVSPLLYAHQVEAPTLILLGKKDLRVPMSQGLSFYHALKAVNVKTKVLMYEDNHPLSQVQVELDSLVNSALWFLEHTNHTI